MKENYTFDFIIPQGPTGPKGENEISAFGGKYIDTRTSQSLEENTQTVVLFDGLWPSYQTSYVNPNSIIILQDGIYELSYVINVTPLVNTTLIFSISIDGVNYGYTSKKVKTNETAIFSSISLQEIPKNTEIYMNVTSLVKGDIKIEIDSGFIVKKIK